MIFSVNKKCTKGHEKNALTCEKLFIGISKLESLVNIVTCIKMS